MNVRWGLAELPGLLADLGLERPFLVASPRWEAPVEVTGEWREVPSDRVDEAAGRARGADSLLAVGGGSAIDLAKAISVETDLPVVSVPTTYSGAEWTPSFGIRDHDRRMRGGGAGATLAGIVYEPELTLGLPRAETVGTSMNALAHTAEALYVKGRNDEGDREALAGAHLIGEWLPRVVESPDDLEARRKLLEGAHARGRGARLGGSRSRARHGAGARRPLRAPARRDERADPPARAPLQRARRRSARSPASARPSARATRPVVCRSSHGSAAINASATRACPKTSSTTVAEAAAERAGARANPRPATPSQISELLRSIY